jgi:hypothetical protein
MQRKRDPIQVAFPFPIHARSVGKQFADSPKNMMDHSLMHSTQWPLLPAISLVSGEDTEALKQLLVDYFNHNLNELSKAQRI